MSERNAAPNGGARLIVPFLVGDAVLLAAAYLFFWQGHRPMTAVEVIAAASCTALGAWLGVWPFVLLHRAALALVEADRLVGTLAQIQQLESVADQIATATGQWQTVQEHANRSVTGAREIAERMDREAKAFVTFFAKADESEKAHLRLEVEKLRRAEADWLQALVRVLDHVFALYLAAARSAQPNVAQQIGAFQHACRDAARRLGLVPVTVDAGTPFDPKAHQPLDPNAPIPASPVVAQVVGTGYSFQGQPLRPIVVVLKEGPAAAGPAPDAATTPPTASELPAPFSAPGRSQPLPSDLPMEADQGPASPAETPVTD